MLAAAAILCLGIQSVSLLADEYPDPGETKLLRGTEVKALVLRDFIRFDSRYVGHREQFGHRLDTLARQLAALQAAGNEMECSNEIYLEAKWLHRYTADWDSLEKRLDALEMSLRQR